MKSVPDFISVFRIRRIHGVIDTDKSVGNPFDLLDEWITEAVNLNISLPNSMQLSMVESEKNYGDRAMVIRGFFDKKFVFFTNCDANSKTESNINSQASVTLIWSSMLRRVKIHGNFKSIPEEESENYLSEPPFTSCMNPPYRGKFNNKYNSNVSRTAERQGTHYRVKDNDIRWKGYSLTPEMIEFCQGVTNLIYFRVRYLYDNSDLWHIKRLFPAIYYG